MQAAFHIILSVSVLAIMACQGPGIHNTSTANAFPSIQLGSQAKASVDLDTMSEIPFENPYPDLPSVLRPNSQFKPSFAGNSQGGYLDGPFSIAMFNAPFDNTADAQGNIYVADTQNHRIRKISPDGMVSTLAGDGVPYVRFGSFSETQFDQVYSVEFVEPNLIYALDTSSSIYQLNLDTETSKIVAYHEETLVEKPYGFNILQQDKTLIKKLDYHPLDFTYKDGYLHILTLQTSLE